MTGQWECWHSKPLEGAAGGGGGGQHARAPARLQQDGHCHGMQAHICVAQHFPEGGLERSGGSSKGARAVLGCPEGS